MNITKSQLTRPLVAFLLAAGFLVMRAEDKPAPTIESLTADVARLSAETASLKAQLDASIKTHMADAAACWTDDLNVVQRRYEAAVAQKKAAALAKHETPKADPNPPSQ